MTRLDLAAQPNRQHRFAHDNRQDALLRRHLTRRLRRSAAASARAPR
ncbi:hypothetical protein [Burkholderia contaminans]|nr:hypothetical protein [Burkholderia contaminans]